MRAGHVGPITDGGLSIGHPGGEGAGARGDRAGTADPESQDGGLTALLHEIARAPFPDAALDRWIDAVRRQAEAARVALALVDGPRSVVRVVGADDPDGTTATELGPRECLERLFGGAAAFADAPVVVAGSEVGRLAIADPGRSWSADELAALGDAAAGVSAELERRLARNEAARVQQLVTAHNHVHDMIARGAPLQDVLVEICEIIERYDPSLMPSVLLRDPVSNTLHSGVGPSFPEEYLASVDGAPIGPGIGTCGPAAWFGEFWVTEDVAADAKWDPIRPMAELARVRHCWSMPIKNCAGEVLGTLALYGRRPRSPQPEHVALLEDWARVAATAVERARSLDRLTHDARHDSLTGLPNRAAIFETLDGAIQCVEPGSALAVLFVDLDGLKTMNDTLGHDVADEMIREVAQRLSRHVRDGDFVGRIGGDEFIVVAERITDPEEAGRLGERLLEAVAQPLPGLGSRVVTASIGIALVRTSDIDAREAIRRSDAAMYEAKRTGRDRCVFAEVGGSARAGRRLQLARRLRGAETRGELRLVYLPTVALPGREVVGVEALLRWDGPAVGEVGPSEFVPIAEDTGSILQIGAWVLWESCGTIARLAAAGHPIELAVNISARQLSQPDFPLWVRQTLSHAQLPADRLSLDLTETALLRPDGVTVRNIDDLDGLGVRVALDDFGTGYSSLAWLRDHPFATLKIDRSFVAGLQAPTGDRVIVGGIIRMAKDLGCTVVAEGVETEEQLEILRELGCDRAQGFLFGRPAEPADLPGLLGGLLSQG